MSDIPQQQVYFVIGRMNPPTPGHIYGLCIPFLQMIRLKAISIIETRDPTFALSYDLPDGTMNPTQKQKITLPFEQLLDMANIVPRIYLTNSTNEHRISKLLSATQKSYYNNVIDIVASRGEQNKKKGVFYVKDDNLENPLDPEDKRQFLIKMLLNVMNSPEYDNLKVSEYTLSTWIEHGICSERGPQSAIDCVVELTNPKSYENVYFLMGEDENPNEMKGRLSFCRDPEMDHESGIDEKKVNCDYFQRIDTTGQGASSMSASKIRILMANNDIEQLKTIYIEVLSDVDVIDMTSKVRTGLRLPTLNYSTNSRKGGAKKRMVYNKTKRRRRKTRSKRNRSKRR